MDVFRSGQMALDVLAAIAADVILLSFSDADDDLITSLLERFNHLVSVAFHMGIDVR